MYIYKTERELTQYFADKKRVDTHCFCMSTISYPVTYDTKEHQIYRIIGGIARRLPEYKNGLDWMYREKDGGGLFGLIILKFDFSIISHPPIITF